MKVLVIGGTRFVGLRLVKLLAKEGHDITLLNRGKTKALLPPGLRRHYIDRRDSTAMKSALANESFEAVFDMTGYQVRNLEPLIEILNGKINHYIFQSTCGVYAESEFLPILEDFPYLIPVNGLTGLAAYEQDKADCEKFLLKAYEERGFPVTIFRCPMIYGPENWMDDREGSYFARLLQQRRILIPGNGSAVNHFAHVDDVARAHLSVVGKKQTLGHAYNIAGAEAVTIKGYVDTIAQIIGVPAGKVYLEPQEVKLLKRPVFPFTWERTAFSVYKRLKSTLASGLNMTSKAVWKILITGG